MIKYFNIHDLVKIKIQTNINSKMDFALKLFREFEERFLEDNDVDIFIYDYFERPDLKNHNYLDIPDEKICFNFIDKPLIMYCDRYIISLNFLVELVLLGKGYSFIHSAAVRYGGKNYLFPAFGGVGKTTLASAVLDNGGKLFGDDMVIVGEREILSFPKDFAVYLYHLDVLKIRDKGIMIELMRIERLNRLFNSKIGKSLVSAVNYFLIKIGYIPMSPEGILDFVTKGGYALVPPKKVFGGDCIVKRGGIDEVYYLSRTDVPEITVEKIDFDLANICTYTALMEWPQSVDLLLRYSVQSDFSLDAIYNQIYNLFRRTFARHKCHQIKIPNDLDNLTFQKQLISYFRKQSGAENCANAT